MGVTPSFLCNLWRLLLVQLALDMWKDWPLRPAGLLPPNDLQSSSIGQIAYQAWCYLRLTTTPTGAKRRSRQIKNSVSNLVVLANSIQQREHINHKPQNPSEGHRPLSTTKESFTKAIKVLSYQVFHCVPLCPTIYITSSFSSRSQACGGGLLWKTAVAKPWYYLNVPVFILNLKFKKRREKDPPLVQWSPNVFLQNLLGWPFSQPSLCTLETAWKSW